MIGPAAREPPCVPSMQGTYPPLTAFMLGGNSRYRAPGAAEVNSSQRLEWALGVAIHHLDRALRLAFGTQMGRHHPVPGPRPHRVVPVADRAPGFEELRSASLAVRARIYGPVS